MPFSLADLNKRKKTITVDFDGQSAEVTYRVHVLTPSFYKELAKREDLHQNLVFQVQKAIVEWEVEDEQGNVIDPSGDGVEKVPTYLLQAVMNAVSDDITGEFSQKKASS